ncbi:MAG: yhaI [Evtepia sp.]|nr:yhaI [Evtepia sp.]
MNYYLEVLKKYAIFDGRARRKELWMFLLVNFLIGIVFSILYAISEMFYILWGIYCLAILVPSLAVGVRRLHDIDKNGLWILLSFIPIANIVLLVLYCMDGTPGENRFGPNPKEIENPLP